MRVKDLLLQALSRANHIEDGSPADARELNKARTHFNSALSAYSDSNLITAFQKVLTMDSMLECVIGKYNMKRGLVMHTAQTLSELPDPRRLGVGKDLPRPSLNCLTRGGSASERTSGTPSTTTGG